MNGTFCKVICEKERGVVTASQTGHRLLRITLSEKKQRTFSVRHIFTHFPPCLASTGTGNPIYDHYISSFFFEMKQ